MLRYANATLLLFVVYFCSCNKYEPFEAINSSTSFGYIPNEFVTEAEIDNVRLLKSEQVKVAGSTFINNNILYIAEKRKGVHVFDNSNPQNPKNMAFIAIPALLNFTVKDTVMIATNGTSLISIYLKGIPDIIAGSKQISDVASDPLYFSVTNRLREVVDYPNYPDKRNVYFQCTDSLGYVLNWKLDTTQKNITCYR